MSVPAVIFDNGSGYLKAGLSTSKEPDITIPALIGRPMLRYAESIEGVDLKPLMLGDEVIPVRSLLDLSYPIKEGIVENSDDLALLWEYAISEKLGIKKDDLKDRKILLTEAPSNPTKNKLKMAEILFETMGFGYMNIEPQAKLTLYCEGSMSGIVLDSGDGVSHCIPITDSYIQHHHIKRLNIAGRHITQYLIRLLQVKGYAFNSTADFELVRELKEKYCFISCNIDQDRKLDLETTYYNTTVELPDRRKITLSNEKFEATEILFQPHLCQSEQSGIHEMVFDSINSCSMDVRKALYGNIVLSGATTMFPGFASRFENEIKKIYIDKNLKNAAAKDIKIPIKIVDSPRRKFSVFIGGCVLAEFANSNANYWITKKEFDENGEGILLTKCPNVIL